MDILPNNCLSSSQDLGSTPADISVTLDGLSHIVTPELARDLTPELITMLKHSRPQIRKRAVLALYKLVKQNPEIIPTVVPRFEEKLEDLDPSAYLFGFNSSISLCFLLAVIAAAINVLCELARQNPKDYLSLAPQLFHLLTTSSNNWMLIKIIKLVFELPTSERFQPFDIL
jgi:AP-3 complex subunit delta-1